MFFPELQLNHKELAFCEGAQSRISAHLHGKGHGGLVEMSLATELRRWVD